MSVDPRKPRKVLVVHGVQSGTNDDLDQHEELRELIQDRLNGVRLSFYTDIYRYENINDEAQAALRKVLTTARIALATKQPLLGAALHIAGNILDLVGDVVIALRKDSVAQTIREGLRERILQTYAAGEPLYLVAHSLGSIYALDVINELIRERPGGVFDRDRRRSWPVQGLITLGSPLGLGMFNEGRTLAALGPGRKWFRWFNYWSRTDPVVTGSFYGQPAVGYEIAQRFVGANPEGGWIVQDRVVDSGRAWLPAHTAYWSYGPLGDDLVTFISA